MILDAIAGISRGLDPRARRALADAFVERRVPAGTVVFSEGQPGDSLLVVLDGVFELTRAGSRGQVHLADAGPGTVLGLVALLDPGPRTATLRALDDAGLAVLDAGTFQRFWHADGEAAAVLQLRLAELVIGELRAANRRLLDLLDRPMSELGPPGVRSVLGVVDEVWRAGVYR